jgi:hypothetical protein
MFAGSIGATRKKSISIPDALYASRVCGKRNSAHSESSSSIA